jgi:phosphatidylserine decarboxylase
MVHALASFYLWLLSRPSLSRQVGRAAEARLPGPLLRGLIAAYVRLYGVDLAEAAEPVGSFRTFDEFFTRRLRADIRPLDAAVGTIVSPCDARLSGLGRIPEDRRLEQIKGRSYSLDDLLGNAGLAAKFGHGAQATLYLSPAMYHRVHWPVDGHVVGWRRIPGRLYPVNALAIRHVDRLFAVNQRVVVEIQSEVFGPMSVVLVGATNVGRISLTFREHGRASFDPQRLGRAVEAFGGSPGGGARDLPPRLHRGAPGFGCPARRGGPAEGDLVRMGQALWRRA